MTIPQTQKTYSLGDLRLAAEHAVAAGDDCVSVDAKALLALCRSEAWAHSAVLTERAPIAAVEPAGMRLESSGKPSATLTTKENATFEEWCAELDRENAKNPDSPYGTGSCVEICGAESWRDYYDIGYCPADALSDDAAHA